MKEGGGRGRTCRVTCWNSWSRRRRRRCWCSLRSGPGGPLGQVRTICKLTCNCRSPRACTCLAERLETRREVRSEAFGSKSSFGVVKTLLARSAVPPPERNMEPQKVFRHPFCCFNNRMSRLAGPDNPLVQKSLLRNSFRCQWRQSTLTSPTSRSALRRRFRVPGARSR